MDLINQKPNLQFHVAASKVLGLHAKFQAQRGRLESLAARHNWLVWLEERLLGRLAIDEPIQVGGRLRTTGRAVHLDGVANLVARPSTGDAGTFLGEC